MKVISLLQPWASLVILGEKKLETRSFNTKYRGPLLIHASAGNRFVRSLGVGHGDELEEEVDKLDMMPQDGFVYPYGAIIGQVELVDTFQFSPVESNVEKQVQTVLNVETVEEIWKELAFGNYSADRWGWVLQNPIIFPEPISAKGQLGFWNYDLTAAGIAESIL